MKSAVVLLSGGMDSCVALASARKDHKTYPLHLNYRHLTEKKELACFNLICDHWSLRDRLIVDIDYLRQIGGSALLDRSIPLEGGPPEEGKIPSSYVPFRNTHLLSIAVSWAEVIGASRVFIGAVAQDGSGYPDTRPEYIDAFNRLVRVGAKRNDIEVVAPLIRMKKSEIVKNGCELGAPFEKTWSCYRNNDLACGDCQSCHLRMKAFEEAGVKDPVAYR